MQQYLPAALGGALIAISAVLLMGTLGRIAGISGIVGRLLPPNGVSGSEAGWRIAFFAGLLLGPLAVGLATGSTGIGAPVVGLPLAIIAGLLVGAGTSLGNGCTSGHGICGLSRLSVRSAVAVATFMATAIVTVFITHHLG
ncbi:YeeE/YedE family protein [Oleomonas cavernae]|uniref:YeeE/YedE family protein n=1 Tax=Oleomonas cavernae TaxID=2320859 RepID=A0A418WJ63_9PROT|nr:YeeE/YedE thiosulfate transporter family protein [Oleomonas cavernae]RJF90096.1 YeeE/YedE family protein [Oleomonas cavernae]